MLWWPCSALNFTFDRVPCYFPVSIFHSIVRPSIPVSILQCPLSGFHSPVPFSSFYLYMKGCGPRSSVAHAQGDCVMRMLISKSEAHLSGRSLAWSRTKSRVDRVPTRLEDTFRQRKPIPYLGLLQAKVLVQVIFMQQGKNFRRFNLWVLDKSPSSSSTSRTGWRVKKL